MKTVFAVLMGMLLGGAIMWWKDRPVLVQETSAHNPPPPVSDVIAAAQGRVEGRSESIEVEAAIDGVIATLNVKEGEQVKKDQILGQLACENMDHEIRALEASRDSALQVRARLLRGSRDEERRIADQGVAARRAALDQARLQFQRMQSLAERDDVPRQAADTARRDMAVAEAALASAIEQQKLANAGPLPEELLKAEKDIAGAEEKLRAAVEQRNKCSIRAPISGTITRLNMRVGEAFSTVVPRPILTMADLSERRIRTEVNEQDLAKVRINQKVRLKAEGFEHSFNGRVIWRSVVMGRKTVISNDPAEKADRDILEVLIAPDQAAQRLPLGLRVVTEFLAN